MVFLYALAANKTISTLGKFVLKLSFTIFIFIHLLLLILYNFVNILLYCLKLNAYKLRGFSKT